jgi:hypothetical protein
MTSKPTLGELGRDYARTLTLPWLLTRFDGTIRAIAYSAFVSGAIAQAEATPAPPRCLLEPEGDPPGGELPQRRPLPGSDAVSAAWEGMRTGGE